MGIFGSILHKLGFGNDEALVDDSAASQEAEGATEAAAAQAETSSAENTAAAATTVDVTGKLNELAANGSEDLDWKASIVDLMKLVGLDSSYAHRKELAAEMGIDGYEGTAEQNIELHKKVLTKLAENGGNVPADLLA